MFFCVWLMRANLVQILNILCSCVQLSCSPCRYAYIHFQNIMPLCIALWTVNSIWWNPHSCQDARRLDQSLKRFIFLSIQNSELHIRKSTVVSRSHHHHSEFIHSINLSLPMISGERNTKDIFGLFAVIGVRTYRRKQVFLGSVGYSKTLVRPSFMPGFWPIYIVILIDILCPGSIANSSATLFRIGGLELRIF